MKIEESYLRILLTTAKKFPVLKQSQDQKVQLTVRAIMQIAKEFHTAGWKDSDPFSLFGKGGF